MAHLITLSVTEFKYSYLRSGDGKRKFAIQTVVGGDEAVHALIAKWNIGGNPTKLTKIIAHKCVQEYVPDDDEIASLKTEGASWDAKNGCVLFSANW